jgi:hypothetical protein
LRGSVLAWGLYVYAVGVARGSGLTPIRGPRAAGADDLQTVAWPHLVPAGDLLAHRQAIASRSRRSVAGIPTSSTAVGKIEVYAAAVARLIPQTAPLREALRKARETDADCAATWRRLVTRRAANMRLFAAELRSTGELRDDLTDEEVADLVWSTNAAEYWLLLVQRGWTPARYEVLLVNVWSRTLPT